MTHATEPRMTTIYRAGKPVAAVASQFTRQLAPVIHRRITTQTQKPNSKAA